jgi:lysylphosphatidylglycerol synthetase-like protein (DUF2156 family)
MKPIPTISTILLFLSIVGCVLIAIFYIPNVSDKKPLISCIALILVGCGSWFTLLSRIKKQQWTQIFKEFSAGLAFILWGISLITSGLVASILGDIVVIMFILDLAHTSFINMRNNGDYTFHPFQDEATTSELQSNNQQSPN